MRRRVSHSISRLIFGCGLGLLMMGIAPAPAGFLSYGSLAATQRQSKTAQIGSELLNPKTVQPIKAEQFRQVLAHHRGEVVLVNLWATWCIPCVREMPDLSRLQQQLKDKGLKVIGVSMDEAQDLETRVKPFFKKRAVSFVSYLQNESDPEDFVSVLDEGWEGILPTTYVLDRSGKLKRKLLGSKTYEEFSAVVTPFLKAAR